MPGFTTTFEGTVIIGAIQIPLATTLPPPVAGQFVFDYEATDVASAEKIQVGEFITWAANALGISLSDSDLPTSLQQLSIAVLKLHFDTTGVFEIKVQIGSMVDNQWDPNWQPISSLNFILQGVAIGVSNVDEFKSLVATLQAAGGAAPNGALGSPPATAVAASP